MTLKPKLLKALLQLVMSLNMGYLLSTFVAWNGECVGDALWPSVWSRSDSHARSFHATILNHFDCNCIVLDSNLHFGCADFEAVGTG